MGIVDSFVTSLAASGAFALLLSAVQHKLNQWQIEHIKKKLRSVLEEYTEKQEEKYKGAWDFIEQGARTCIPQNQFLIDEDIRQAGANRDMLLELWMERYDGAVLYQDDVKSFCKGWIDCTFDTLRENDNIRHDMEEQTARATHTNTETLKEGQARIEEGQARMEKVLDSLTGEKPAPSTPAPEKPVTNCTEDYRDEWNKPLFLNDPSFGDDVQEVLLSQVHIPHRYSFGTGKKAADEQKKPLLKRLAEPGGHLVLGDPGIGKSTLITRYLNESEDSREMRVYRLSEFYLTGQEDGAFILQRMGLEQKTMSNLILFLDGLDECGLDPSQRIWLLKRLQRDWSGLKKKNVSWVITCRRNYVPDKNEELRVIGIPWLRLLPMEAEQIEVFLTKYQSAAGVDIPKEKQNALKSTWNKKTEENVFGNPLILYMTAAIGGIKVKKDSTLVTVYDRLFEELFQRAYNKHKVFSELEGEGAAEKLWEEIQKMDRHIALWMFFNQPGEAFIPKEDYERIEKAIGGSVNKLHLHKFHSYMHYTEGENELCFIHRTIYEYFVADGFVSLALSAKNDEGKFDEQKLYNLIAWYWHKTPISPTIHQYLTEKLRQPENKSLADLSLWERTGLRLLERGVKGSSQPRTDSVAGCPFPVPDNLEELDQNRKKMTLIEDRERENTAFYNLCRLLICVKEATGERRKVFERLGESRDELTDAIRHCGADRYQVLCPHFYLRGADLRGVNLIGADLQGVNLSGAKLSDTDLSEAVIRGADLQDADLHGLDLSFKDLSDTFLSGANLVGADLRDADLSGADLRDADLSGADLSGANLSGVDLRGANLRGVHLSDADLSDADLSGADLSRANLSGLDLRGANLRGAHMSATDLRNADLSCLDLRNVDLGDANLGGANLRGVDLRGANLVRTNLEDTDLNNAVLTQEQVWIKDVQKYYECNFSSICIEVFMNKSFSYTRSDFFSTFFPNKS